jgi:hypothetical protein
MSDRQRPKYLILTRQNKGDMNNKTKKQLADAISNAQSDTLLSMWEVSNKPLY